MTIDQLIEELEVVRRKIDPRSLSPREYEHVGWADRPLRQLIDQCRQEQESILWLEREVKHCRLDPRIGLPEPLPERLVESSP